MTRRRLILALASTATLCALAVTAVRACDVPKVATGFITNVLCSETFVSGLDPAPNLRETIAAMPRAPLLPEIAGAAIVAPQSAALATALDRAFAEPDRPPFKRTRAVVVVKDGRIIAERYADSIGIDTPLLGFSATKSVISALTGILVRQGKLALDKPAPVAAWQRSDDPRHAITVRRSGKHAPRRARHRATPSPSISCCATPQAWRSAARCRLRSAPPSSRSTG